MFAAILFLPPYRASLYGSEHEISDTLVDYAAIPELRGVNLEPYRTPPVVVVRINFLEPGLT
jgi:hypothetical protein